MKYTKNQRKLYNYIKENLDYGYSLKAIKRALLMYGYDQNFVESLIRYYRLKTILIKAVPLFLVLITLIPIFFFSKPKTVGFAIITKEFNFSDEINLATNKSLDYLWVPENKGTLKAVKLDGEVKNSGTVKIYLQYENNTYLIFDNRKLGEEGLEKVTAFAIEESKDNEDNKEDKDKDDKQKDKNKSEEAINKTQPINETTVNETQTSNETINVTIPLNETITNLTINITPIINETINITPINKSIIINLQYKENTPYDEDNDGIEATTNAIDFSIAESYFNWDYDDTKLCSRLEVYSIENEESTTICYGSSQCCNFLGLLPTREKWNETFYLAFGQYGATFNNIISAQVVYVNYNLSLDNLFSEIYYSNWNNISAKFYEEFIKFEDVCIETCILPNLNASNYNLRFEIENSSLVLYRINYGVLNEQSINNPPILLKNFSDISVLQDESFTINLSGYFYDPDNDTLNFNFYNNPNIGISIHEETITLTPVRDFIGTEYMFFTANDSINSVVSNTFKIEFKENKVRSLKSLRKMIGMI